MFIIEYKHRGILGHTAYGKSHMLCLCEWQHSKYLKKPVFRLS
jgi:hypothetical protein